MSAARVAPSAKDAWEDAWTLGYIEGIYDDRKASCVLFRLRVVERSIGHDPRKLGHGSDDYFEDRDGSVHFT
jgi:hypothetical protein